MISSQSVSSRRTLGPYLHQRAARGGKAGKGCVFGCLAVFVVLVAVVVGLFFFAGNWIKKYTEAEAVALPAPALSQEQAQPVLTRAQAFEDALSQGTETPPLELTADELNALLAYDPDLAEAGKHIHVRMEGDTIGGEVSVPVGEVLPFFPMLKGRYFNGDASGTIHYENGQLEVYIKSLEVEGEPIPEQAMQQLSSENMAKEAVKEEEVRKMLETFESIKVENGRLIITPKPASQRTPMGQP